jgi:PEGA domain-containing protein
MRETVAGAMLVVAMCLSLSTAVVAKGSGGGGGHGGGHSGGHGGASAGGHSGRGRSTGTNRGAAGTRDSSGRPSTSGTSTNQTASGGRRRDGQPVGTAVPKESVTSASARQSQYAPYWLPSHYGVAFGFGLGYLSCPFYGYGYSSLGYGSLGGWHYGAYPPSGYALSGYEPSPFDNFGFGGSLRLKVKPRNAEVYVDGYYAGIVDDFDGHFQHLDLTTGRHHIQVRAPGYQPLEFDVDIQFDHKTVYGGALTPLQP